MFLYLQEYEEEHAKLVSVVTSMEQNIKALLKDFDSKKKVTRFCIFNDPFYQWNDFSPRFYRQTL